MAHPLLGRRLTPAANQAAARSLARAYLEQCRTVRALTWLTQRTALAAEATPPGAERQTWMDVREQLRAERAAAERERLRIAAAVRKVKVKKLEPRALERLYHAEIARAGTAHGANALLRGTDVLARLGIIIEEGDEGRMLRLRREVS